MIAILILIISLSTTTVLAKDVCYEDLGCFTDEKPFSGTLARPIAYLPEKPEKINTTFILYNKKTNSLGEVITASSIGRNYDPKIPTKFITHGLVEHAFVWWVIDMKNAILNVDKVNVVAVDWSKGNDLLAYEQATANTQIVGAEIAKLINSMIVNKGARAKDFHLIGHSLGYLIILLYREIL